MDANADLEARRPRYSRSRCGSEVVVAGRRHIRRRGRAAQSISSKTSRQSSDPLRNGLAEDGRATRGAPGPSTRSLQRAETQAPRVEIAARDFAASSPDLATLRSNLERFEGCALKRTATQLVFADGAPGSRVMFVGEAPGGDEDRIGRPFVGRAGQLLDRMLNAVGLDRGQVYIANVVPWRPPGNRTPTLQETQACLPFIKRQIELAAPEILVCLGASSTQTLLGVREGIMRARGLGLPIVAKTGARFARSPCCIPPICCGSPDKSDKPGPICARLRVSCGLKRLSGIHADAALSHGVIA